MTDWQELEKNYLSRGKQPPTKYELFSAIKAGFAAINSTAAMRLEPPLKSYGEIEFSLPADGQYMVLVRELFEEPGEYKIFLSSGGEKLSDPRCAATLVDAAREQGRVEPVSGADAVTDVRQRSGHGQRHSPARNQHVPDR